MKESLIGALFAELEVIGTLHCTKPRIAEQKPHYYLGGVVLSDELQIGFDPFHK